MNYQTFCIFYDKLQKPVSLQTNKNFHKILQFFKPITAIQTFATTSFRKETTGA